MAKVLLRARAGNVNDACDPSESNRSLRPLAILALVCASLTLAFAHSARADEPPVSFQHDVQPILRQSCAGCHRPEKKKGKLDLSTYSALTHGGKSGPALVAGEPDKSRLIDSVSGDEPAMPDKGEKLSATEVALLSRWVKQGAKDDTTARV